METILIIGASGQLGSVMTRALYEKYGMDRVIASDLHFDPRFEGKFIALDATDFNLLEHVVTEQHVSQIYHLAAILSANGEKLPMHTWDVNMKTFFNVLEVARLCKVNKVFFPSSIAVFGDGVDRINTPQGAPVIPSTVYGMSKVAGENWCNYYHMKYGMDIRSVRFPGLIGHQSLPGGGTTDYAVDIFHKAVKNESFECFLEPFTTLPMMYMDDAVRAAIELMEAPAKNIKIRTSYNLAGMSFSPEQLANSIQKIYWDFKIKYRPDFRQQIAESWPTSIDDTAARRDWGWKPAFNLDSMTETMIDHLEIKYQSELLQTH